MHYRVAVRFPRGGQPPEIRSVYLYDDGEIPPDPPLRQAMGGGIHWSLDIIAEDDAQAETLAIPMAMAAETHFQSRHYNYIKEAKEEHEREKVVAGSR